MTLHRSIRDFAGVHQSGDRAGNWPTREQARDLRAQPELETMEENGTGRFWRCFWAALCAGATSRRSNRGTSNSADGRWAFVDLVGGAGLTM
jgi:hypothetical protein